MNRRVILSPDARADVSSAIEWYHQVDPNLASRFERETLTTLHHIQQFPYRFRIINGTIRRAPLKRFPYAVYYSLKRYEVSVTAVLHQRRSDAVWVTRGYGHK